MVCAQVTAHNVGVGVISRYGFLRSIHVPKFPMKQGLVPTSCCWSGVDGTVLAAGGDSQFLWTFGISTMGMQITLAFFLKLIFSPGGDCRRASTGVGVMWAPHDASMWLGDAERAELRQVMLPRGPTKLVYPLHCCVYAGVGGGRILFCAQSGAAVAFLRNRRLRSLLHGVWHTLY